MKPTFGLRTVTADNVFTKLEKEKNSKYSDD